MKIDLTEIVNHLDRKTNPYYIITPPYSGTSAGIKVLHILTHCLNLMGYRAYIIPCSKQKSTALITPELTIKTVKKHLAAGENPIIIQAETCDIKLGFPCNFVYLLNYIGFLNDKINFAGWDKKSFWSYSENIAKKENIESDRILFIPILNLNLFHPPKEPQRKGMCCYLGKYYENNKNHIPEKVKNYKIFTRKKSDRHYLTQEEYSELLRNSELIYIYEDTAVIMEALLCECPVVLISSDYHKFDKNNSIGIKEIGNHGIAFGDSEEEIKRAKETVHLAKQKIEENISEFSERLNNFIKETQKTSNETTIEGKWNRIKILIKTRRVLRKGINTSNEILHFLKRMRRHFKKYILRSV